MSDRRLRILIANEKIERLAFLTRFAEQLGHDVVARSVSASGVAATAARERADVALVGLGESFEHALDLVSKIVADGSCPVIAVLCEENPLWVSEAARRGVFAYVIAGNVAALRSTIDIAVQRFRDKRKLESSIERLKLDVRTETEFSRARLRRMAELNDEVVQGIATAKLAHELGRGDETYTAIRETLERARVIMSRSLAELKRQGIPAEQMIAAVARTSSDG